MEPMNLLVVERDADWSQWGVISRGLGRAVLVLVQQADESTGAFHERIARRLQRGKARPLNKVVLLGNGKDPAFDPTRERMLRQLGASAQHGLRVYPAPSRPFVPASEAARFEYALS
jgi:hypothetical protein